jgi:DsbC/DsbD-like thiol-disulfide interchange protein
MMREKSKLSGLLCNSVVALIPFILKVSYAVANVVYVSHVTAELVSENEALVPGERNTIALRIVPDPGWHIYWRNPGDSGIPTSLRWELPPMVTAGPLQWPSPSRETEGDAELRIVNYTYANKTLLLTSIYLPSNFRDPPSLVLRAHASWAACNETCVPGETELSVSLPVRRDALIEKHNGRLHEEFVSARSRLPQAQPNAWRACFKLEQGDFILVVEAHDLPAGGLLQFFPYASTLLNHSARQRFRRNSFGFVLHQKWSDSAIRPAEVDGVLESVDLQNNVQSWELRASASTKCRAAI